jgi:hypothetical protein
MDDNQTLPLAWCIVANIVHERPYGPGGQERRQISQFAADQGTDMREPIIAYPRQSLSF